MNEKFTPPSSKPQYKYSQKRRQKDYSESALGDSDSDESQVDHGKRTYQKDLKWQAVSSFVFLRFFVPAILNPHLFGLVDGLPSEGVQRTLKLIAKIMQSLANLNAVCVHRLLIVCVH